jgi:Holliday junction resolvase RusA-like endonuclease
MSFTKPVTFSIAGIPPSKSNAYRIITLKSRTKRQHASLAKTKATRDYERSFDLQIPNSARINIMDAFVFGITIYFPSRRADLDNALKAILDCLQKGKVIQNDRQCQEIHAYRAIDKENPRIEIILSPTEERVI